MSEPIAQWLLDDPTTPRTSGTLTGVRVAVKELIAVQGAQFSANSAVPLPAGLTSEAECSAVTALRAAGARIVATTTTHEFAWGITGREGLRVVDHPTLRGRIAGGSSSGSAWAVASGAADIALGTDTSGSIRIPSAWCGLFGWRPTHGNLPLDHVLPLAPSYDTLGLIAREAVQLVEVLKVLGTTCRRAPKIVGVYLPPPGAASASARRAVTRAASALATLGYQMIDMGDLPLTDIYTTYTTLQLTEGLETHREQLGTWPVHRELYSPGVRARLERAEKLTGGEVTAARKRADHLIHKLRSITSTSLLLLPATGCAAPLIATPDLATSDGRLRPTRDIVLPFTTPASLAGLPAAVVPWGDRSEPVGVQLVGGQDRDGELLSLVVELSTAVAR